MIIAAPVATACIKQAAVRQTRIRVMEDLGRRRVDSIATGIAMMTCVTKEMLEKYPANSRLMPRSSRMEGMSMPRPRFMKLPTNKPKKIRIRVNQPKPEIFSLREFMYVTSVIHINPSVDRALITPPSSTLPVIKFEHSVKARER